MHTKPSIEKPIKNQLPSRALSNYSTLMKAHFKVPKIPASGRQQNLNPAFLARLRTSSLVSLATPFTPFHRSSTGGRRRKKRPLHRYRIPVHRPHCPYAWVQRCTSYVANQQYTIEILKCNRYLTIFLLLKDGSFARLNQGKGPVGQQPKTI